MSTLFISHSSNDESIAKEVKQQLAKQNHFSVFLDFDAEKGITAGQNWEQTLYRKLRACEAVIVICTYSFLSSKWCFAEVALARMESKRIFTLLFDSEIKNSELPSIMLDRQIIDMTGRRDLGYEKLWKG